MHGDHLHTFRIYPMGRTKQTRQKLHSKYRTNTRVFLWRLNQFGGLTAVVMGKEVCIKVWIHYFIGNTEGFNKWLGHYPGNRKEISRPYRDCKCNFYQLSDPNPTCEYVTIDEMHEAKRLKINNENEGAELLR